MTSGRGSKKLQHLDLSGCNQITSDGYFVVAHNCRLLKTLHVNDNDSIDDRGLAVCFVLKYIILIFQKIVRVLFLTQV